MTDDSAKMARLREALGEIAPRSAAECLRISADELRDRGYHESARFHERLADVVAALAATEAPAKDHGAVDGAVEEAGGRGMSERDPCFGVEGLAAAFEVAGGFSLPDDTYDGEAVAKTLRDLCLEIARLRAEVAAAVAAKVEECVAIAESLVLDGGRLRRLTPSEIARDIRARGSPDPLAEVRRQAWREALEEASDAAHNAVHDAIYEMPQCAQVKGAVSTAIRALMEADDAAG